MKKILLALCAIAFAPAAYAQSLDFTVLADSRHPGFEKMQRCVKKAWNAARPDNAQRDDADRFIRTAKSVLDEHKDALMTAMESLKTAWSKHPIVPSEVVAAEDSLRDHAMPVKDAFRDAGINSLNLLSAEQRSTFDGTFKDCID